MIVLLDTNTGTKKAFIRDKIFMEVDASNKKIPNGTIRSANIKNVLWLDKGKFAKIPVAEWIKKAEEKDMWSLNG
jgi:hypothetical protein